MCKKDPQKEPAAACQYDSSVEGMKEWCYFKTGTWWVYREQTTGELDTITVYSAWSGTYPSGNVGFETLCNSSYDGFNYIYRFNSSFSVNCLTEQECTCHKLSRVKTMPGTYVGEEELFLFPVIQGNYNNIVGYPNGQILGGTSTATDVGLSMDINGNTIEGVTRWNVTTDQSEGGWPSVYFFARSIGIVGMEFPHEEEIWRLLEYHIIQ